MIMGDPAFKSLVLTSLLKKYTQNVYVSNFVKNVPKINVWRGRKAHFILPHHPYILN